MNKIKFILVFALIQFPTFTNAQDDTPTGSNKETIGFGIGALIGGLIAGPPGAVIGAAGGTLFSNQAIKKGQKITALDKKLQEKNIEIAYLQNKFTETQSEYAKNLHNVKLENKQAALTELSKGISFSIYFRTGKSDIEPVLQSHLHDLVDLIMNLPEIKVNLDAHADHRGDENYNLELSRTRANTVEEVLKQSGLSGERIQKHAYGELQAQSNKYDREGLIFDRRVDIYLTIDTEV